MPGVRGTFIVLILLTGAVQGGAQPVFTGGQGASWEEAISRYEELARMHSGAELFTIGSDDDGSPIHLFVISDGGPFDPAGIRATGRNILWITNGIHPGEPDGIDASLLLAQALLEDDHLMGLTVHTAVCIVPVYNVWGARQRSRPSRPEQNGPPVHGIRANARNLDLNRDFVKMDAMNTRALVGALQQWDPDIYFETHVSDGADHQYVMELLMTRKEKLDPGLAAFMTGVLEPALYQWMDRKGMAMCPYFEPLHETPEEGLAAFHDPPRYSTGFNALFDRIGILSESHMLKPYADRVNATCQLMLGTLAALDMNADVLRTARAEAKRATREASGFGSNHMLDTTRMEMIPWTGYEATHGPGAVGGQPMLLYRHERPTNTTVPWYDHYAASLHLAKPLAYLIPQAWKDVIGRLEHCGVEVVTLEKDTTLIVDVRRIEDHRTGTAPFEGHYVHRNVRCSIARDTVRAFQGDALVPMGRWTDRFALSVLEPEAEDSYFAWGFFDPILQRKEWFTPYAFEPIAAELLARDAALRSALEDRRRDDPAFNSDAWAQLLFIFDRSPWAEQGYLRYPAMRVVAAP